jgi:hypothetical protein
MPWPSQIAHGFVRVSGIRRQGAPPWRPRPPQRPQPPSPPQRPYHTGVVQNLPRLLEPQTYFETPEQRAARLQREAAQRWPKIQAEMRERARLAGAGGGSNPDADFHIDPDGFPSNTGASLQDGGADPARAGFRTGLGPGASRQRDDAQRAGAAAGAVVAAGVFLASPRPSSQEAVPNAPAARQSFSIRHAPNKPR